MSPSSEPSVHAQHTPSRLGWLSLLPLTIFVAALTAFSRGALPWSVRLAWVPTLGVDFALHIDGLALQMILLIAGVGAFVFIYAAGYMAGEPGRRRLAIILLLFMVAMLGCVSADNLIVLFAFWEITSITSFLLVGFDHERESSRKSAQQALFVTFSGGLVLLAGFLLLGNMGGSYSISELLATAPAWRDDPLCGLALLCVVAGAFTKSAQFPFHFWLPNAMAAPTPVSAYLHSATMVKLGIYLLARLDAAFDLVPFWTFTLVSCGGLTAAWAMLLTLRERDLKRILAWSTVAALGTMTMLIGLPGDDSAVAVAALLLAHALYKAPLFFVAGNIDHGTGTRNIQRLSGLAPLMPWTAAAALLAALSMSGFPMSFGFFAKELTNIAKKEGNVYAWVGHASVLVSAFSVAVAGIAAIRIFWHKGERGPAEQAVHEAGWAMRVPPLAIASIGILFGLRPRLADPLVGAAAEAMHPRFRFEAASAIAASEPGWLTLAFAVLLGGVVYVAWDKLHALLDRVQLPTLFRFEGWYHRLVGAVPHLATATVRVLQRGTLTWYLQLQLAFVCLCVLGGLAVSVHAAEPSATEWVGALSSAELWGAGPAPLALAGALGILLAGAVAVCRTRDSFVLLLASGLMGLGCALLFLFLGAPDLAFTQFAVEVAFVVVIASTLLRVRRLELPAAPSVSKGLRLIAALLVGALTSFVLLVAFDGPLPDSSMAQFYGSRSLPEAHGRNVVNVILVDFRALDTLGEIVVVLVSFLAVVPLFATLRQRPHEPVASPEPNPHLGGRGNEAR